MAFDSSPLIIPFRSKFGDLKVLRPVAPAGYVALGDVSWPSHQSDPPLEYMRCVHTRFANL